MTESLTPLKIRPLVAIVVLICLGMTPTHAQDDTEIHFASDDSAVHFNYPSEWTMEAQSSTFNQAYRFELWTQSSTIAAFITNEDRSRIVLEITNPLALGYTDTSASPRVYHVLCRSRASCRGLSGLSCCPCCIFHADASTARDERELRCTGTRHPYGSWQRGLRRHRVCDRA